MAITVAQMDMADSYRKRDARYTMSELDSATFKAAFPAIHTAIKIRGDACGMRIQLDIPESEMGEAIKMLQWRQTVLTVTVEPEKKEEKGYGL